jgi:parallel beta-helix repeat protein
MIKTHSNSITHRIMHSLIFLLAVSLLYGCGAIQEGKPSSLFPPTQPSKSLSVTVVPLAVEIRAGDVEQFSARVLGSAPPAGGGIRHTSTSALQMSRSEGLRLGPISPGTAARRVTWSVNGIPGGDSIVGTINANGLYSSPSSLPTPNAVEVTATSVAEPLVSQTALLTLFNRIPTLTSVAPSKVLVGPVRLTVRGQGFVEGAKVLFAGTSLLTTFISSTQLLATGVASQTGNAQVLVSNPQPGSASSSTVLSVQVTAPQPVTTPPTATQTWNTGTLGVPWASDFNSIAANQIDIKKDPRLKVKAVGNGSTDDTLAIRAAIQLASSSGGGLVYFPAGDYKVVAPSNSSRGNPLVVPSRVILQGDSPTTSRVFVNDPFAASETDGTWTWGGISFQGTNQSGMTDLGLYSVNASSRPCALIWNRGSAKTNKLFFNNLDIHLNRSRSFWFEGTDNLLIQNSRFDSDASQYGNSSQNGPIYVVNNSNVLFLENKVTYHFGRLHMQNNVNMLIRHNTLIRDADNKDMDDGTAIESGGVELSFGQNIQVLDNLIQTLNAPPGEAGDGEAIMTQQSTVENVLDVGRATALTPTTLTDTKALWGSITTSRLAKYSEVVAILTGNATGQWRSIQDINTTTKTLTLTQPWSPVPENGSLYSIFSWTLINANIEGNTLIDNPNGIVLYDGCYNCSIRRNALTNSRGIILRTADVSLNPSHYPEGRRAHFVAINNSIIDNRLSNISGVRPAYIALDAEAFEQTNYRGAGIINTQVSGNTIEPYASNPNQTYVTKQNEIAQEGFFPCFLFGPAALKDPVTTVFQGVHFWNNFQNIPVIYGSAFLPFTTHSCVTPSAPPATKVP